MKIHSQRISLEPLNEIDTNDLIINPSYFFARRDLIPNNNWPHYGLLARLPLYHEALIEDSCILGFGCWFITKNRKVIGDISITGFPDPFGAIEIGYYICASDRNKGFATEAILLLSSWAFRHSEVKMIKAFCSNTNFASQRALMNAGFTFKNCENNIQLYILYNKKAT